MKPKKIAALVIENFEMYKGEVIGLSGTENLNIEPAPKSRKFNDFHLFDPNPKGEHLKIIELGNATFEG